MIKLKQDFDINKLTQLSTINCAIAILENSIDTEILQTDLVELVATKKNMSKESVSGTLWGGDITPRSHKLMGQVEFKSNWFVTKLTNGRNKLIKIGSGSKHKPIVYSYDTTNKQLARARGAEKYLKKNRKRHPVILTLGSEHGYDIEQFLKIKPDAIVYNVENNLNIFLKVIRKNWMVINFFGDVKKLISEKPDRYFDIINLDLDGYLCSELDKTLKIINEKQATKYLCLTIQNLKNFRNSGEFANRCREQYGEYDDPTMEYFKSEAMQNYNIIDTFSYNKNDKKISSMKMIVFELKC